MRPFPGMVILFVGAILIGALVYTQAGGIFDNGEWKTDGKLELSGTLSGNSPFSNPAGLEVRLMLGSRLCDVTLADNDGNYRFDLFIGLACPEFASAPVVEGEYMVQIPVYVQTIGVNLADDVRAVLDIVDDRSDGG